MTSTSTRIFAAVGLILAALNLDTTAEADSGLTIPKGYRKWFLVNSMIVSSASPLFAMLGGMHNVSINAKGLAALKSGGTYPDGSLFLDDIHEVVDANGVASEGPRKAIAVMLRNSTKYAATGGWGFQVWAGGDPKKPLVTDAATQCFGCHASKKDNQYVFSTYIP